MARRNRPDLPEFRARLTRLRTSRALSQAELAVKAGTTQHLISAYETGRAQPTAGMLVAVARALQVSTDQLLGLRRVPANSSTRKRPRSRILRLVERIEELAEKDQRAILRMVSSLSNAARLSSGK